MSELLLIILTPSERFVHKIQVCSQPELRSLDDIAEVVSRLQRGDRL